MHGLKNNLPRMYLYKLLSDFWLIAPILIPFYQSNGLTATQVFAVQAVYSAAVVLFEVPSGYFADVFGRRMSLILGAVLMPAGLAIYAFSNSFITFCIAELFLAMAAAMRSGADSALVYDTLKQLHKESEYKFFAGRSDFYMRIGTSVSAVLSGFLAMAFLRLPFYLNILSGIAMSALSFTFIEPHRKAAPKKHLFRGLLRTVHYTLLHPKLRTLTLLSMVNFTGGIIGIWSYYLLYQEQNIHIVFFGIIFAFFALVSGFGARKAHKLEKLLENKKSLFLLVIPALVFILLGLVPFKPVIVLVFVNGFILGLSGPLILDQVNRITPSRIRATVISIGSMSASLGFAVLSPLFGRIADAFSLSTAFIVLGCFMLICFIPIFYLLRKNKAIND